MLREAAGQRLALEVSAFRLTREAWTELAAQGSEADLERALERAFTAKSAATLEDRSFVVEDGALTRIVPGARRATMAGSSVDETGVVPVLNPALGELELGLQGDLRATIAPGGSLAIVDVDLALRRASLGARATFGGQEVQLPETSVTRLATTLTVPLGRTVFVGGTFGETASVASPCVFSVRVQRFGERAVPAPMPAPSPRGPALVPSTRAEVVALDALLVLVEDALAKVRTSRSLEWRTFDVRDLLEGSHARSVPRLGVLAPPPSRKSGGGKFAFDDDTEEAPVGLEPEKLEGLLKNATGADAAWSERPSFRTRGGQLLIRQTPGTLARIEQLLVEYRKDRSGDVQVLVELCRVDDARLAELTRGGAALAPDLLKRVEDALAAGTSAVRVASGFVLAQRGDPGVLHGGVETAYIAGFERMSGGTGMVVQTVTNPLVRVARQGFAMAGFGHGSLDGGEGALTVGARFGLARLTELASAHTPQGAVSLPALDRASGWFDGPSPSGAVALVVDRRVGEARPTLVAIVRSRLAR